MNFRVSTDGNANDILEIQSKLEAYNVSHGAGADKTPLGIYYEDEQGNKQAGLVANIFGNWLFVEFLFVSESLRGQGIGGKLLSAAEQEAKRLGCKYAYLTTNAFQAPGFYDKMGYKCVFVLEEFPRDGKKFHFTKEL